MLPEISPEPLSMLSPPGRPTALKVTPSPAPFNWSDTASPSALLCAPGLSRAATDSTAQANVWLVLTRPSETVTVTESEVESVFPCPGGVVPVIRPLAGLMLSPAGRLTALQVNGRPLLLCADRDSETGTPSVVVWSPGLVRAREAISHSKLTLVVLTPSVTLTV